METGILLSGVVIAVFAGSWLVQRVGSIVGDRKRRIQEIALRHGWTCEIQGAFGYTVSGGTDGVSWQLVVKQERRRGKSKTVTRWSCDDVSYPHLIAAIRSRQTYKLLKSRIGRKLIAIGGHDSLSKPSAFTDLMQLLDTGTALTMADSALNETFGVIVQPGADAENLLTGDVERALRAWEQTGMRATQRALLEVDVGAPNLRVEHAWPLQPQYIEPFVDIGVAIASALKKNF